MLRAVVFLASMALVFGAPPQQQNTSVAAEVMTSRIVSHGLDLRLTLPRRSFPWNALIRVRVSVRNVSHHVIPIDTTDGPECAWIGPGVEVLDANGTQLYPGAVPIIGSCGPYIPPRPLAPGQSIHHTTFVILRGALIRAIVTVSPVGVIRSNPLHLTLRAATPPALSVQSTPALHVTVTPSNPAQSGPIYYQYSILCPGPAPAISSASRTNLWQRGTLDRNGSYTMAAECNQPIQWAFTGGWVGEPVASLDFRAPASPRVQNILAVPGSSAALRSDAIRYEDLLHRVAPARDDERRRPR